MNKNNVVTEGYTINGFKHLSTLALEYFPGHTTASAAVKQMRTLIVNNEVLSNELKAASFTQKTTILSPEIQFILYRHWGPPKIFLPIPTETMVFESNA